MLPRLAIAALFIRPITALVSLLGYLWLSRRVTR